MTRIILVRHGENDWVKKKRLAGWTPGVHLNETGRRQAAAVAERLATLPITAVYSSPVTRCMETAEYIAAALGQKIGELADVGEVRFGKWEGKKLKKLAKKKKWRNVQFFPSRFRFPQGEAMREVQFRAIQALETLSERYPGKEDIVVVVSHSDVIRLILAHYLGTHIDLFQRVMISPAALSVLDLPQNGSVRVVRVNDDGPLRPPEQSDEKKKAVEEEE
jgi:probable phosphoglycerate mutase